MARGVETLHREMEMVRQSVNSVSAYSTMLMDAEPRSRSTLAVAIANFDLAPRRANNRLRSSCGAAALVPVVNGAGGSGAGLKRGTGWPSRLIHLPPGPTNPACVA